MTVAAELPLEMVDSLSKTAESVLTLNRAAGFDTSDDADQEGGGKPSSKQLSHNEARFLREQQSHVGRLIQELEEALPRLDVKPRTQPQHPKETTRWRRVSLVLRRRRKWVVGYAAALVLVMAALYALVPRPDPTSDSIAEAMSEQLGPGFVVDCDSAGEDWVCHVAQLLSPAGNRCELTTAGSSAGAPQSTQEWAMAALSTAAPACEVAAEADFDASLDKDDDVIELVPRLEEPAPVSDTQASASPEEEEKTPQWMLEAWVLSTREPPIEKSRASTWLGTTPMPGCRSPRTSCAWMCGRQSAASVHWLALRSCQADGS